MDKDATTVDLRIHEFMQWERCKNGNPWPQGIELNKNTDLSTGLGDQQGTGDSSQSSAMAGGSGIEE